MTVLRDQTGVRMNPAVSLLAYACLVVIGAIWLAILGIGYLLSKLWKVCQ